MSPRACGLSGGDRPVQIVGNPSKQGTEFSFLEQNGRVCPGNDMDLQVTCKDLLRSTRNDYKDLKGQGFRKI